MQSRGDGGSRRSSEFISCSPPIPALMLLSCPGIDSYYCLVQAQTSDPDLVHPSVPGSTLILPSPL